MYKHWFPTFKVFKCNFSVARLLWQLEWTSCMVFVVECLHVCTYTQNQLDAIGLIAYEQKVNLVMLSWLLTEEQKLFTLREPECSYSIRALSCYMPATVEQNDSEAWNLGADRGWGAVEGLVKRSSLSQAGIQNGCSGSVGKHIRRMHTFTTKYVIF